MNYIKYYTRGALMGIVLAFTSGGILQTFFAYMGFSESQIGLHTTVINVAQIAVMILNIFLADGIRNVKVIMAVFGMGPAVFAIGMLPSILILVSCGAFQLASGVMYYVLTKKLKTEGKS